ncbi:uncharacterized protein LOC135165007 [Diachasmimorpha longicaudata]|uniref:uncharacterized protein LOC135165007 n=1 Tax=Diachasmimorpha longicaudata TaxID=58733 RepID=UPI0030B8B757
MAADLLEAKIHKIRQQNEEIRRRYEEVEADKQNAAKSNALVQMVPSTDWPERKEPPEFVNTPQLPKNLSKPRNSPRESNEGFQYRAGGEPKKVHMFSQSEGPPPDPKYNFLADSEREERHESFPREGDKNKARGKPSRPHFRKQRGGRECRGKLGGSGQDSLPDYEAWRAERNKIDEARISRQKTAEGNWKREWDNDKMHLVDDTPRYSHSLGDAMRYPRNSSYSHGRESDHEKRFPNSTDKNSQINHSSNTTKNPLMSVKVSTSNIVGTGRVGPRQRSRVVYSTPSEKESMNFQVGNFLAQSSPEDTAKSSNFNIPKDFHSPRKIDSSKFPQALGRELERNDSKSHKTTVKSPSFNSKDYKNFQKSPHVQRRNTGIGGQSKSPRNIRKFEKGLNESMTRESVSSGINEFLTSNGNKIPSEEKRYENVAESPKRPNHEDDISNFNRDVIIEVMKEVVETVGSHGEPPHIEAHESVKSSSVDFCNEHNNDDVSVNIKIDIEGVDKNDENVEDDGKFLENENKINIALKEQKQEEKEGVSVAQDNLEVIEDDPAEVINKPAFNSTIPAAEELRDKISAPDTEEI